MSKLLKGFVVGYIVIAIVYTINFCPISYVLTEYTENTGKTARVLSTSHTYIGYSNTSTRQDGRTWYRITNKEINYKRLGLELSIILLGFYALYLTSSMFVKKGVAIDG